ncbi:glycosyltransferase family 4 protein [Sphingopyxis sp. 113P3]|uniref:glycosyltransferase family 4 protein n=1 Tax=Sphingopyxis sp. (strain 113P3) TaxID=292913 RepID=UPI0006AD0BC1|nr:glycosyltransferase family 4 protein [Sphingopyxis sp. 113P3]ALC12114.1 glycosyl transferase [Sphingopyxis sp. 113P3]
MSQHIDDPGNTPIAVLSSYAESLYNFRGDLIRSLVERGHPVYALAPDFDSVKKGRVEALGATPVDIPLERNGLNILRDLRTIWSLYRFFRTHRPRIFFGYFMKPVIYGTIAAWLARVPRRVAMVAGLGFVFINAEQHPSLKARLLRCAVKALYAVAFRCADKVIFQNRDDLSLMLDGGVVPPERVALVHGSGVNLNHFRPALPRRGGRPVTFVWTGRLLREKGVLELVEATRALRDDGLDLNVILVGGIDGNPGSLQEFEVRQWHDEGIVHWVDKVDDVRPYLQGADVFVLPSYREGLPRSTQEAMATGLAVITTDVPGCRETVIDGLNGMLVPVRSAVALAAAMRRYLNEPSLAAQHGEASLDRVRSKFDVEVINQAMRNILVGSEVVAPRNDERSLDV